MNAREQRAQLITEDQIKRIDEHHYTVKSQSTNKTYDIISTESGFSCNCKDYFFRKVCCKHIHAVEISLKLRKQVENQITINPIEINCCKFCNSDKITKKGIKKTKHGEFQQYKCKDCNKRFTLNFGFEKMRATPEAITASMNLYFNGESLRHVSDSMKLFGVKVTHVTVLNWIKRYSELMEKYIEQITPQVSDKWRTDELYLKIKGNRKYLYALMDDDTRYWIAKQVSDNKYKDNIQQMFRDGKKLTQKKPKVLISDGATNFHRAFQKEFYTHKKETRPIHIQHIHFKGDMNNNKMERLNGEIRDREKVIRGLKKTDSPMISGYQLYHNYIRNHMGLEGKTPAEACGIKIEGENKWITLIQNASK